MFERAAPILQHCYAVFHIMDCCSEISSSSVSHVGAIGQPLFIAASTHPEHHSSVVSIIHLGLNTVGAPHTHHTCISPEHLNECGGSQNWVNHQCELFREYNIIKDEISTSNLGNIYDYYVCLYVFVCMLNYSLCVPAFDSHLDCSSICDCNLLKNQHHMTFPSA